MMHCHQYQRQMVEQFSQPPVLNGACKECPSGIALADGDVNMDIQDFDPQEQLSLYDVPNFVQGSLLNIPFPDKHFGTVVLGEFLEHCPFDSALLAMRETHRVLKSDGIVIVTIPLDPRPKEVQHPPHQLIEWEGGITSWHITVWHDDLWTKLLGLSRFVELKDLRVQFNYGFCLGFGAVLKKCRDTYAT